MGWAGRGRYRSAPGRPIYALCLRLVDPATGEEIGAFAPSNDIDRRLAKDRGYRVGHEYRLEIKASRNAAFHRLAHVIGHLLVDNVEAFRDLDAHAALKQVQLDSGICCEMVEMDASPVVKALLDAAETVLGAGARKVLAAVLPEIRTIPVKVAQSLAFDSMEEEAFAGFFKGITAWIGDHTRTSCWTTCARTTSGWSTAGSNRGRRHETARRQ